MFERDGFHLWLTLVVEKKGVMIMKDYYFTDFKGTINDNTYLAYYHLRRAFSQLIVYHFQLHPNEDISQSNNHKLRVWYLNEVS